MMCDVRYMHPDDVLPMWKKVRRWIKIARITADHEDGELFMEIRAPLWRFDSHARGFVFHADGTVDYSRATVFISYYPPGGGNVRFDSHVSARPVWPRIMFNEDGQSVPWVAEYESCCDQLVREYGEAMFKHGHQGKNRLSAFEKLEPTPQLLVERVDEPTKPWWKFW